MTRYEQRQYAQQLRRSPMRGELAAATGQAFDHYIRTDRAGARPVPPDLLERWITYGWLQRVEPPMSHEPDGSGSCTVLDPFAGAGTTGVVALRNDRSFLGLELSAKYCDLARWRIRDDAPLMNNPSEVTM